jgi:hypothetical protein
MDTETHGDVDTETHGYYFTVIEIWTLKHIEMILL